jgi:lipid A 4'-phosphatase
MSAQPKKPTPWAWWQIAAVVLIIGLPVYELAPSVDATVSSWFYQPADGFWMRKAWPFMGVYYGTRVLMAAIAIGLLGTLIRAWSSKQETIRRWRLPAAFALVSLALGPWLLAHAIKDHYGRARPASTVLFGGSKPYTPPWQPSANCDHNCSFVSAHAIVGFWFITGAWVWPKQRRGWWIGGIAAGTLIGLVRIAQGAHFVSDVLGAFVLVWATNAALAELFRWRGWPIAAANTPRR